jgi:nucleosome binding factor SPN SPT16 subunit
MDNPAITIDQIFQDELDTIKSQREFITDQIANALMENRIDDARALQVTSHKLSDREYELINILSGGGVDKIMKDE